MLKSRIYCAILFLVVYIAYGSSYLLRMPFGIIKDDIIRRFHVGPKALGYVDLAFLLPYAVVSLTCGSAVEFLGPQLTLSLSLMCSASAMYAIHLCESFLPFLVCVAAIGVFQAQGWPAACALISSAFESSKSSAFGVFGTCCFLGAILGKILTLELREAFSWSMVFVVPSIIVGTTGCVVLVLRKCLPSVAFEDRETHNILLPESSEKGLKKLSFWQMFTLPGVPDVSCTIFFVKSIRYMFIFWLPLYMSQALAYTPIEGGFASISFDTGGMLGSLFIGIISDKWAKGRDMLVCFVSIILCTLVLITFYFSSNAGWKVHGLLLVLAGSLNGGADVLLTSSVASKLGKRYANNAAATITSLTGIVNGVGSLGTIMEGPIVAVVTAWFGWSHILIVIIAFSVAACGFAMRGNAIITPHHF